MALIKCSECGEEISDKAEKCPKCGCPTKSDDNYSSGQTEKVRNKKIIFIVVAMAAVIMVLAIIFVVSGVNKKKNYEQALELMEDGKSQEAYDKFVKLKDYKDSDKYEKELYEVITYEKAMACLNDGEFAQAIELLKEIPDYPEAKTMLALMTSKYSGVSDDTYFVGMYILTLFNSSDFENRIGNKLKTCIDSNFGDKYDQTSVGELMAVIRNEEYIVSMINLINSIPESSGEDKDFKKIILSLYKMKLDGIFANYVDGDTEYNSTVQYQVVLKLLGIEDKELYDLYELVDEGESYLSSGKDDISELAELFGNIADCTMFDDIDE